MMTGFFMDSRSFSGLKAGDEQDSKGASFVEPVVASDLRVGKSYCMMGGFPVKIKELNRAAPGKHGHAKLRTVGQGIFDGKKRETIFQAQQVVQTPVVQKHQNVKAAMMAPDGYQLVGDSRDIYGLPVVLPFQGEENDFDNQANYDGKQVVLTVLVACGHYKIMEVQDATNPEPISAGGSDGSAEQVATQVLSKKEVRKRKKLMQKQASVASA